jgi:hypothetical protein
VLWFFPVFPLCRLFYSSTSARPATGRRRALSSDLNRCVGLQDITTVASGLATRSGSSGGMHARQGRLLRPGQSVRGWIGPPLLMFHPRSLYMVLAAAVVVVRPGAGRSLTPPIPPINLCLSLCVSNPVRHGSMVPRKIFCCSWIQIRFRC